MNIKEESLKKALTAIRLPELPKQLREDNGEYWLEAVVLVRKMDSTMSYARAKRGADGRITYMADYGMMSPIMGLVSIHPYLYLDRSKYMPYDTAEQKREALTMFIGGDDAAREAVSGMSDSEVEKTLLQAAIEMQYNAKATQASHSAIIAAVKGGAGKRNTVTGGDNPANGISQSPGKEDDEEVHADTSALEEKRRRVTMRRRTAENPRTDKK